MKIILVIITLIFSTIITAQNLNKFKTDIDLGGGYIITTFLEFKNTEKGFLITSPKNADKRLFGGVKSTIGRVSGKIQKGGILISLEGTLEGDSLIGKAVVTGFGKLDFKGKLEQELLTGELYAENGVFFGSLSGVPTQQTRLDFTQLYDKLIKVTEENIYSKEVLQNKEWKKFTKELKDLCEKAQDDVELFFGFNIISANLPFSHYSIIFKNDSKEEDHDEANAHSIVFEEMNTSTAYLKIKNFSSSQRELSETLPKIATHNKYENLIVDLRDNGGGGIEAAFEFAKYIVEDKVIVGYFVTNRLNYRGFDRELFESLPIAKAQTTDDFIEELRSGKGKKLVFEKPDNPIFTGNLYVLTNNQTASTCEPIVYILKNTNRAVIIGENTAGAMLSAAPIEVSGKYSLYIPIADFYTYEGSRLDQIGVVPDVLSTSEDALEKALLLIQNKK